MARSPLSEMNNIVLDDVPLQFCSEEDEVFFGQVSEKERYISEKADKRRTVLFIPGFRRNKKFMEENTENESTTIDRDSLETNSTLSSCDTDSLVNSISNSNSIMSAFNNAQYLDSGIDSTKSFSDDSLSSQRNVSLGSNSEVFLDCDGRNSTGNNIASIGSDIRKEPERSVFVVAPVHKITTMVTAPQDWCLDTKSVLSSETKVHRNISTNKVQDQQDHVPDLSQNKVEECSSFSLLAVKDKKGKAIDVRDEILVSDSSSVQIETVGSDFNNEKQKHTSHFFSVLTSSKESFTDKNGAKIAQMVREDISEKFFTQNVTDSVVDQSEKVNDSSKVCPEDEQKPVSVSCVEAESMKVCLEEPESPTMTHREVKVTTHREVKVTDSDGCHQKELETSDQKNPNPKHYKIEHEVSFLMQLPKTFEETLEQKKARLLGLRQEKERLQRKVGEGGRTYPRSPVPKPRPKEGSYSPLPKVLPKRGCSGRPALILSEKELAAVTKLHTIRNSKTVVRYVEKTINAPTPTVIKHFDDSKQSKIQWKEEIVADNVHHTPTNPLRHQKPILIQKPSRFRYAAKIGTPSPVVLSSLKNTNTLGDESGQEDLFTALE